MSNELDFDNLDGVLDSDMNFPISDSGTGRNIVSDVSRHTRSVAAGVKDVFTVKNIGKHILEGMPDTKDLLKDYSDAAEIAVATKNEFKANAKPLLDATRGLTKYIIDSNKRFIPNKVYRKLDNFARANDVSTDTSTNTHEDELKAKLDEVFAENVRMSSMYKEANTQQMSVESSKISISRQQLSALASISGQLQFQNKFTISTTRNYMRKMLELSYRQLFYSKGQLQQLKALNSIIATSLSALVKNTSLPDALKYKGLDMGRSQLYGAAYNKGINSLKSLTKKAASNAKDYLVKNELVGEDLADSLNMFTDSMQSEDDMNADSGIGRLGKFTGSLIGKKASKKLANYANTKAGGAISLTERKARNLRNELRSGGHGIRKSLDNSDSGALRFLGGVMGSDSDLGVKVGNSMLDKPTEATTFDVLTRQSIVEVIPAWLAKIAKNTRDLFVGKETDLEQYDIIARKITNERTARANISKHIFGADQNAGYGNSVGATLAAIESSGLTLAVDKATLEKNIKRIISNAIVLRLPIRPGYLKPVLQLTSDSQLTDKTLLKLAEGVTQKVDTLHALYFTLIDSKGNERFDVVEAINAGVYSSTSALGFREGVAETVDSLGYRNLLRNDIDKDGTFKQSWMSKQIRNVDGVEQDIDAGRGIYDSSVEQHAFDMQNILGLKQSGLKLLNRDDPAEEHAPVKSYNLRNMRTIAKQMDTPDGLTLDDMVKTFESMPGGNISQVRDMFNIVQQLKIIQLEKEILHLKQNPGEGPVAMTHKTMQVPDINYFDDNASASKDFRSKYGRYDTIHRPYLMQAQNSILMRAALQDIGSFLKARFSLLPSWRRLQIKTMEGIHIGVTKIGKGILGLGKTIAKAIVSPLLIIKGGLKMLWGVIKNKFEIGTGKLKSKRERATALSKLQDERDATERQIRTMVAVERTANTSNCMQAVLTALNKNTITGIQVTRLLAKGRSKQKIGDLDIEFLDPNVPGSATVDYEKSFGENKTEVREELRLGGTGSGSESTEKAMSKYDKRVDYFKQHLKEVDYFSKAMLGLKTAGIAVVVAAVIKQLLDSKSGGQYLKDLGLRTEIIDRFDDKTGTLKSTGRMNAASHAAHGELMNAYNMSREQRKTYETALAKGPEEARIAAEAIKAANAEKIGKIKPRNSFQMFFKQRKLETDTREALSVTKEQRGTMEGYLKSGDDAGYAAYVENLKKYNKTAAFGGNIKGRVSDSARAEALAKRRKILINKYKLSSGIIDEYMKIVLENRPNDAARYLADARANVVKYNKSIEDDITGSIIGKVWNMFFSDGALKWSEYGIDRAQESMVKRLSSDRYNYEAEWLLEDINWSLYANSKQYNDTTKHKGTGTAKSTFAKVRAAAIVLNSPSMIKQGAAIAASRIGSSGAGIRLLGKKKAGELAAWGVDKWKHTLGFRGKLSQLIAERPAWLKKGAAAVNAVPGAKPPMYRRIFDMIVKVVTLNKSKVLGGIIKVVASSLQWLGKLVLFGTKYLGPVSLVAGFIWGLFMDKQFTMNVFGKKIGFDKERGARFDAQYSGDVKDPKYWLNIVITALDPWQAGVAAARAILLAGSAIKASVQNASSSNRLHEVNKDLLAAMKKKIADGDVEPEAAERMLATIERLGLDAPAALKASIEETVKPKVGEIFGPAPKVSGRTNATAAPAATKAPVTGSVPIAASNTKIDTSKTSAKNVADKEREHAKAIAVMGGVYSSKGALDRVSLDNSQQTGAEFKWNKVSDLFKVFNLTNESWKYKAETCLKSKNGGKDILTELIAAMVYTEQKRNVYVPGNKSLGVRPFYQQQTPRLLADLFKLVDELQKRELGASTVTEKDKQAARTVFGPPDQTISFGKGEPKPSGPVYAYTDTTIDTNAPLQVSGRIAQPNKPMFTDEAMSGLMSALYTKLDVIATNSQSFVQMPVAMAGMTNAITNAPAPQLVMTNPTPEVPSLKIDRAF